MFSNHLNKRMLSMRLSSSESDEVLLLLPYEMLERVGKLIDDAARSKGADTTRT
jgi:hypothetical protein